MQFKRILICGLMLTALFLPAFQNLYAQTNSTNNFRVADSLAGAEKWSEAGVLYHDLAVKNEYNGYYWSNYGYCLYKLKDYSSAITSYQKACESGFEVASQYYNIACCYSLLGNTDEAVSWLEKSEELKFPAFDDAVKRDTDFDAIRNSESYKQRVNPSADMFKSREEGWRADIQFFKKRMEHTHYNIFGRITKDEWEKELESLLNRVNGLNDFQILAELYKITASVGDGHTTVIRPENEMISVPVTPLSLYMFDDGLYVIAAQKEYAELAGKKIVKFGNVPADKILDVMRQITPRDNEFGLKWKAMRLLTYTGIMYGMGVVNKEDETEITIEGGKQFTVKAERLTKNRFKSELNGEPWVQGRDTSKPLMCLADLKNIYWYRYLPEKKMVYMQYNVIQEKKELSLQKFTDSLFEFINKNDVNYFVLDIRFNSGGNSYLNKILVQNIIKCDKINKPGHFYTIIGRNTFSAAQNLTGDLERETNVIFAGEPTGSSPNFTGETDMITLPYSGIRISCSSRYWQEFVSDDFRKWIAPQLGVRYTYSDFNNGIDPAMEEIMRFTGN